ncbi:transmembrane protein 53-like isoform X2 [Sinocyclocheilus grahami]|uniref:Transmembrane protein 53-like n=2 Tax=Sinocyclocheilus grahami TaxID=75366 RepID=A0A672NRZ7_SINGR|nr:PREDICTED: transmembrane protein 53-like isoform X1 [Sinocyclocheilus grahami]XP_016146963.1 PREDICTED: transmembrane protein 53-like isoform X2 [Sinocyclocheilus grahami]
MSFIQKIRYFFKRQISRVQMALSRFLWCRWTRDSPAIMLSRAATMAGVTAHKISKHITFLANDVAWTPTASVSPVHPKPILLMLPWLGSRPQAIAKYCDIYFRTGFDVLIVESAVSQFLWPRWGLEYGGHVLELLESECFSQRPLLVHAFSIGGYTFGQVLVHVAKDTQRYQGLTNRIRGHIYDSLVMGSLEHMANGLGKTILPQMEGLVKSTSLLYFRVFKNQTVSYFSSVISVFWNTPVMAPALFFYSENDALCDYESLEKMVEFWRSRDLIVESKKWKESVHAGHLRIHPQDYLSTLEKFVQSLDMVPLKAKM